MTEKLSIREIIGDDLMDAFDSTFGHMSIAEREIEEAQERHPDQSELMWGVFGQLMPTSPLRGVRADWLYASHCRELLDRKADGGEMRLPTFAEMAGTMSDVSERGPLTHGQGRLYLRVFSAAADVIGQEIPDDVRAVDDPEQDELEAGREIRAELVKVIKDEADNRYDDIVRERNQ